MKQILLVISFVFFLSGCATVLGNSADIEIKSTPQGAEVWLDGVVVGHTPTVINVPGDSSPYLVIKSPGFKPVSLPLKVGRNSATYANALWGPLYGIANSIDTLSGNIASIEDGSFDIILEKDSGHE